MCYAFLTYLIYSSEIPRPATGGLGLGGDNDIKPVSIFSSVPHGGVAAMPTLLAQR